MMTVRHVLIFMCLLALAACEPAPVDPDTLPTLLILPSITPSVTPTPFTLAGTEENTPEALATETPDAPVTVITPKQNENVTVPPPPTPTAVVVETSTAVPVVTERPSLTPSMTITDTPTRTLTMTPYTEEDLSPLFQLAIVALSSTPPPTGFYVAPTLTPTGFVPVVPIDPVVPGVPGGILCLPPHGGFGAIFAADITLSTQMGCPLGEPLVYSAAIQTFERGMMIYAGTSPSAIYVLYNTGIYSRFADTWMDGSDPVSGGESAPAGLYEPIRGFGKVWRSDMNVRNGLGWATQPEAGTTITLLLFQNGQMIALPTVGQVAVMTTAGSYRLVAGTP